jgi:O-antigen ligase/tetratricopeptide (TPR) repeat protein
MDRLKALIGLMRRAAEVVILAMACLSPWAFGAVDAWAQLLLDVGLVFLVVEGLLNGRRSDWARRLFCLPSAALAMLALLALVQAVPLPIPVVRRIAPSTHAWRTGLAPSAPEGVEDDEQPRVSGPAATLSQDPDASVRTAAQLAASWLLFQAVLSSGTGYRPFRRFGVLTVVNASLLTLFSIAQALAWNGLIYGVRPTTAGTGWVVGGPFVSHNHLAAYLNVAFGLSLGFFLASIQKTADGRRMRWTRSGESTPLWAGTAAGLIFAGIIASSSRGGFLAAVIATIVTLILLRPASVRLGATLGVMVVVSALFLIVMGSTSPFERLATIKDASQDGISGRTQVWAIALRAWWTFPVWGTGLGSFPAATIAFYRKQFNGSYFSHAESEYLHMLTEGGIIGLALALVAVTAIARLGRRALDAATNPRERALVLGALSGGLALLIQCLSDFPLHIPGVAVTVVIVAGHLCRLGLEASEREPAESRRAHLGSLLSSLIMLGLSVAIVIAGLRLTLAEVLVRKGGLPFPDALMPTVDAGGMSDDELSKSRTALEDALRLRPNWAEGHLRLGAVMIGLYSNRSRELLGQFSEVKNPEAIQILSDPLWLHRVAHTASASEVAKLGGIVNQQPVRDYLIPAARCFLEARRCSPGLPLTHARLAELDYLLTGGETTSVHAARALRLSGYDDLVLALAARAAAQAGDIDLAASCWRKAIAIDPEAGMAMVVAASKVMSPEQILDKVLPPGGRLPLLLADRLYAAPEARKTRDSFLRACLERLPQDTEISSIERSWLEAQARARLGERDPARKLMTEALADDSDHPEWREGFIDWLLEWGDVAEASRQARIGLTLHPDHPGIQRASKAALEAFAQGNGKTARPN